MNLDRDYFFACVDPEGDWAEWVREQADVLGKRRKEDALGEPPSGGGQGGSPSAPPIRETRPPSCPQPGALDNFPGRPSYRRLPDPEDS